MAGLVRALFEAITADVPPRAYPDILTPEWSVAYRSAPEFMKPVLLGFHLEFYCLVIIYHMVSSTLFLFSPVCSLA